MTPEERAFEAYKRQPEKMMQPKKKKAQNMLDKNIQGLYPNMQPGWDRF